MTTDKKSKIVQNVIFYNYTDRIDFKTEVDWQEEYKLLKAYFEPQIRSEFATFDIQNGLLRRQTHANNTFDQAQYEVFGHKFVDYSENGYGVAILNDCKYGYSVRNGKLGLSLLKSSKFPYHLSDMRKHEFTYSFLAHNCSLESSKVFEEAHILNTPLLIKSGNMNDHEIKFLEIDSDNIQVGALKMFDGTNVFDEGQKNEKHHQANEVIFRLYEERGQATTARIQVNFGKKLKEVIVTDGLEEVIED